MLNCDCFCQRCMQAMSSYQAIGVRPMKYLYPQLVLAVTFFIHQSMVIYFCSPNYWRKMDKFCLYSWYHSRIIAWWYVSGYSTHMLYVRGCLVHQNAEAAKRAKKNHRGT